MTKKQDTKGAAQDAAGKMSREEQIGYHKGCLSTLLKERQELVRIVGIVEQLMQFHMGGLKELGVDLTKEAEFSEVAPSKVPAPKNKRPIEEII